MEKVTYGAPRYMDWVAQIKAGAATVKVHFTGGALTVYGVTPAEYTTTNPFIQKVIEQSKYFKEGRITLLKRITLPDPTTSAKPKKAQKKQQPAPQPVETKVENVSEAPTPNETEPVAEADETPEISTDEQESVEAEDVAPAENGLTTVEVSDLQDAQGYLQQNFNIASYKVRSRVSAQKAANEHGIMFVGGGFTPYGGIDGEENVVTEE